jgi:hypothetical protein
VATSDSAGPSPSVADNVALVEGGAKKEGVPIPYGSHPRNLIWAPICNFVQIRGVGSISAFRSGWRVRSSLALARCWGAGGTSKPVSPCKPSRSSPNELCSLNGSAKRTRMPTLLPAIRREPAFNQPGIGSTAGFFSLAIARASVPISKAP